MAHRRLTALLALAAPAFVAYGQFPNDGRDDLPWLKQQLEGTSGSKTLQFLPGVYDLLQPLDQPGLLNDILVRIQRKTTLEGARFLLGGGRSKPLTVFRYTGWGIPLLALSNTGLNPVTRLPDPTQGVTIKNIRFLFAGTRNPVGDDWDVYKTLPDNTLKRVDWDMIAQASNFDGVYHGNERVGGAAILGLGANYTTVQDCEFESSDLREGKCETSFIHLNANRDKAPLSFGVDPWDTYRAVGNRLTNLSFNGYVFGASYVCQRDLVVEHITGDYEDTPFDTDFPGHNGFHGHLLYLTIDNSYGQGYPKVWSRDVHVNDVLDYGHLLYSRNTSAEVSVKFRLAMDCTATNIRSYRPTGALDFLGAVNCRASNILSDMSSATPEVYAKFGGIRLMPAGSGDEAGGILTRDNRLENITCIGSANVDTRLFDLTCQNNTGCHSNLAIGTELLNATMVVRRPLNAHNLLYQNGARLDVTYVPDGVSFQPDTILLQYGQGADGNSGIIHVPAGRFATSEDQCGSGTNAVIAMP
ncbi:MAG: hypothetical protein JSS66_08735 [Armatimonadetes bacterium]|nr:hypothetical protein [Armatimonadota bacterium]